MNDVFYQWLSEQSRLPLLFAPFAAYMTTGEDERYEPDYDAKCVTRSYRAVVEEFRDCGEPAI